MQLKDTGNFPEVFFSAPPSYLGNKISSYMYYLTFDLTQKSTSNPQNIRPEGDVIIKGKDQAYKLVTQLQNPPKIYQKVESYKVNLIVMVAFDTRILYCWYCNHNKCMWLYNFASISTSSILRDFSLTFYDLCMFFFWMMDFFSFCL